MDKKRLRVAALSLCFGCIALTLIIVSPRFENMRAVDMVLLMALGAVLGGGLSNLLEAFRTPKAGA